MYVFPLSTSVRRPSLRIDRTTVWRLFRPKSISSASRSVAAAAAILLVVDEWLRLLVRTIPIIDGGKDATGHGSIGSAGWTIFSYVSSS
jgi:hypothetical protein